MEFERFDRATNSRNHLAAREEAQAEPTFAAEPEGPAQNPTNTPQLAYACRLVFGIRLEHLLPEQRFLLEKALDLGSVPIDEALALLPAMENVLASEDDTMIEDIIRLLDRLRVVDLESLEKAAIVVYGRPSELLQRYELRELVVTMAKM